MKYRVTGIKLELDRDESDLTCEIARKLRVPVKEICEYSIVKKALDARKKDCFYFVYTVDAVLTGKGQKLLSRRKIKGVTAAPPDYEFDVVSGEIKLKDRPVVVGAGPAGIFAALTLARNGFKPLVLERGQDVDTRTADVEDFWLNRLLNTESNVQFGEGGAGTFSDGKLTTRINDPRTKRVLRDLVSAGAPEEIMYLAKPHIGTDILKNVVKNLRTALQELDGEICFGAKVTRVLIEQGKVRGVEVNGAYEIPAEAVVLAIGHSARDTYEMLYEIGCPVEQKVFSIGVRIEHPQSVIDAAQYGQFAGHPKLGASDYQLVYRNEDAGRAAYTFCMCPGGRVVAAASEKNTVVTNGMSDYARDSGIANSAVVVSINPDDFENNHPLAGVEFQRVWEKAAFKTGGGNYNAPAQLLEDFMAGRASNSLEGISWASYKPGLEPGDLHGCLPHYVSSMLEEAIESFGRKINGFCMPDAVMTGVETRTSAPVRINRNEDKQSTGIEGLYPAGEGAGYAGGIVSAAVDGMRVAESIISKCKKI